MTDAITYQYAFPSALNQAGDHDELFLAKYSEVEKKVTPCYFWGKLTDPFITARCLIALSNVVRSSFNLTPAELALLKDPIVTAGNGLIRFEGFSHCAGVYARVDILPDGQDGEFLESGTTNVDFNQPMTGEGAALASLIEDIPDAWIDAVDKYAYANQTFNAALLAVYEGMALQQIDNIAGRLSAMGRDRSPAP